MADIKFSQFDENTTPALTDQVVGLQGSVNKRVTLKKVRDLFAQVFLTSTAATGYVPYMSSPTALANSLIYNSGAAVGIGTTSFGTEFVRVKKDQVGDTSFRVENADGSSTSRSIISAGVAGVGAALITAGAAYTVVPSWTSSAILGTDSGLVNGLILRAGTGQIRFQIASFFPIATITSTGVTIGSTTATSMFNVGTAAQFQVSSTGDTTISGLVTVNAETRGLYTSGFGLYNGATMQAQWLQSGTTIVHNRIATTDVQWQQGGTPQMTLVGSTGRLNVVAGYAVNGTNGADGTFTTVDGKTVTVAKGIITAIV